MQYDKKEENILQVIEGTGQLTIQLFLLVRICWMPEFGAHEKLAFAADDAT